MYRTPWMMTIPAGRAVVDLIELAYAADQPVLLIGRHGVGKSSLFDAAAKRLGIGLTVCDLSLMEPVDLVGIPLVDPKDVRSMPRLPSSPPGAAACSSSKNSIGLPGICKFRRCSS